MDSLSPLQLTEAHLAESHRFQTGQVVVFTRKNKLFEAGEPLHVCWVQDGLVIVEKQNGEMGIFNPKKHDSNISLFAKNPLPVSQGEKLLIRRNGKDQNVFN